MKTIEHPSPQVSGIGALRLPDEVRKPLVKNAPNLLRFGVAAELQQAANSVCPRCKGRNIFGALTNENGQVVVTAKCLDCHSVFSPTTGILTKLGYE